MRTLKHAAAGGARLILLLVALAVIAAALAGFVLFADADSGGDDANAHSGNAAAAANRAAGTQNETPAIVQSKLDAARAEALSDDESSAKPGPLDFEIIGRVLDPAKKPRAKAIADVFVSQAPIFTTGIIKQYRDNGNIIAEIIKKTDADGRFAIHSTFRDGSDVAIIISHPDAAPTSRLHLGVDAGKRLDLGDIVLEDGLSIAGVVLDSNGVAAANARVGVIETPAFMAADKVIENTDLEESVPADEKGNFQLNHLEPGRYTLIAWGNALARGASPPVLVSRDVPAPPMTLRLVPGDSISGTVVDADGKAIPDAKIKVRLQIPDSVVKQTDEVNGDTDPMLFDLPFVAVTDASGNFEAQGLVAGAKYNLLCKAKDFRDQALTANAGATGLRIGMKPDIRIVGRALDDATGAPINGVKVLVYHGDPAGLSPRDLEKTPVSTSDATGKFVAIDHEKGGTGYVLAFGKGYAPTLSEAIQVGAKTLPDVIIKLKKGASLSGTVANAKDRSSIADARVYLYFRSPRWGPAGQYKTGMWTASKVSGADGSFIFDGLMPGSYQVEARPSGKTGSVRSDSLSLAEGEKREGYVLEVPGPAVIRGTVAGSRSIMPIRAIATRIDGMQTSVYCDLDNKFEIKNLGPGTYKVRAEQPQSYELEQSGGRRYMSESVQVDVKEDQTVAVELILPDSYQGKIAGTVMDDNGAGAGYSVILVSDNPNAKSGGGLAQANGKGAPTFAAHRRVTADMQGNFEFSDVSEGNYRLYAIPFGKAITPKNAVASETVQALANGTARRDLFGRSGPLKGIVKRPNGMPVGSGSAVAKLNGSRGASSVLPSGTTFRTSIRKNGTFDFGRLPGGTYDVMIESEGLPAKVVPCDIYGSYGEQVEVLLDGPKPKQPQQQHQPPPQRRRR